MTRAKAAQICQAIKFILDREDYSEAVEEALNMAIAALKQLSLPKIIIRQGEQEPTAEYSSDVISRQAAIDTVMGFMPSLTTPDGCGQFDREIFEAQEMFVDIGQALNKLPSAQPFTEEQIQTMQELESAQVEKAFELGKADRTKWIPCSKRLPEEGDVVLICSKIGVIDFGKRKGDKWVWLAEALWDYWQETEDLIAWMPLPEAYREDGEEE